MDGPCTPTSDVGPPEDASLHESCRRSENARRSARIRHDREARLREALKAITGGPGEDAHPWSQDTAALDITDEKIKAIAPPGYEPTEAQVRFVRAHVYAGPRASLREICDAAQVRIDTARSWLRRYPELRRMIQAATLAAVEYGPRVWRVILARALEGSTRAAEMYLLRFDETYQEIRGRRPKSKGRQIEPDERLLWEA